MLRRLVTTPPYDAMFAGATSEAQRPRAQLMDQLLDWMDVHGGAEAWLTAHGLSRDLVNDLRDAMTATLD
ncbi:MAG: hypothetical protein ACRDRL_27310 [Sciscionella sp.]